MVVLYVQGQRVGTLAEAEGQLPEIIARGEALEFRDETGASLGKFDRRIEPLCPWHPEWTQADIDRMSKAGGGLPLTEVLKRLGAE